MTTITISQDLTIAFKYNQVIIEILKTFQNRSYNPITKSWNLPKDQLAELERKFKQQYIDYTIISEANYSPIEQVNKFKQHNIDYSVVPEVFYSPLDQIKFALETDKLSEQLKYFLSPFFHSGNQIYWNLFPKVFGILRDHNIVLREKTC